jgi:uncharacterized protein YuzE
MGGYHGMGLAVEYDKSLDVMYIWLRQGVERAFGQRLDDARYIDFGEDNLPIGVELLNVSCGVETEDLPEKEAIEQVLAAHDVRMFA